MNVTAHQEKEKNAEMKKGKKMAGEEKRKQATDFEEAVCCPTAVVQGAASRKNEGECPGYLGSSGRPTAISTQPKRGRGPHHHNEAVFDWCSVVVVDFCCCFVVVVVVFILPLPRDSGHGNPRNRKPKPQKTGNSLGPGP